MTAAQSRLAETLGTFYNAADRTSEGAMAAHAYKQSVDDLDQGIGRELVRLILLSGAISPQSHEHLSLTHTFVYDRIHRTGLLYWSHWER
jgi:hypothetical protein